MRKTIAGFLSSEDIKATSVTGYFIATVVAAAALHVLFRLGQEIFKRRRDVEALKQFPGPPAHWLYGNLKEMMTCGDIMGYHAKLAAEYKLAYTFMMGFANCQLRVSHPDSIKAVLTSEPKDSHMYKFLAPWLGEGLLLSNGKKWSRNRRLLTPAFHFDVLKPYVQVFSQSANTLVNKWRRMLKQSEQSVEIFQHISLMTLDSLMKCIFGYQGDCQAEGHTHPYIESVYQLLELIAARVTCFPYHNELLYHLTWSGYKFRRACRVVHAYSQQVIDNKRKTMTSGEQPVKHDKKYLDFLDILIGARDEDGRGLSAIEIRHEVDTFMFEGHDTTAGGISWCLYNLAAHKDFQAKCREEINSVLGDRVNFCWDDINKLTFLTMCLKESLRITPPVPVISRAITKDIALPDGRIIPEGVSVFISIYGCHHNPDVWENPEQYDPYRFSPENSAKRSSHAFIPFSAGSRNCIGQHFALNEMKAALGVILRNFEVSLDEHKPPVKIPAITLRAKDGLWLKLRPVTD